MKISGVVPCAEGNDLFFAWEVRKGGDDGADGLHSGPVAPFHDDIFFDVGVDETEGEVVFKVAGFDGGYL